MSPACDIVTPGGVERETGPNLQRRWIARADFKGREDSARGVTLQSDGKIVVAGYAHADGYADFAVARYSPTGRLNTTLSRKGRVRTGFGWRRGHDYGMDVALHADGRIMVAGSAASSPSAYEPAAAPDLPV